MRQIAMRHVDDPCKILRLSFHRGELHFCEAAAGRARDPWHRLLLPAVDIVLEHRAAAATGFLPS